MIAHIRKDTEERQSVEEHLLGTAELAEELGKELGIEALTTLVHDLGKMRKRFEEYLIASVTESRKTRRGEVNHSSAGAIFLEENYNKGESIARLTAQLMVVAVFSHHGLYDCIDLEGKDCYRKRVEYQKELDYEEVIENFKKSSIYKQDFNGLFEKAKKEVSSIVEKAKKNKIKTYFMAGVLERMLLSVLIDADRLDTAIFSGDRSKEEFLERNKKELCEKEINDELQKNMQEYVSDLENGKVENEEIANIRKQISKECEQFAKNPSGIYRLPVPTGGGKTISSFRYALNHAKEYRKKRIFYIAPYVSILDQNAEVLQKALGKKEYILVHHSNVITKMEDKEQREETKELEDEETYRHLTENWEHPIVITTFVQFLNTLFSDSTQSIRRFHNLTHSVIIIDEIQTLPIRMTALFNQMMNILHELFGATIILCSATQPKLQQEGLEFSINYTEPKDMISNVPMLYEKLKRVKVEIEKKKLDRMKIAEFLMERIEQKQSLLCILNTKTSARKVYENLQSLVEEWNQGKPTEEQITIFHLSTNMCVQNRLDKLDEMKVLLDKKTRKGKVICVSTALIEAGVDISFECVVRGRAGLDSIAQAAGRCNRNGEAIEGTVYIIRDKEGEEQLGNLPEIKNGIQCSGPVLDDFLERPDYYQMDLFSPIALEKYYAKKYNPKDEKLKQQMRYPLEKGDMVDLLTKNETGVMAYKEETGKKPENLMMCQAFRTAGKEFEVIVQNTTGVIVPYKEGKKIITDLCKNSYEIDVKGLLKQAQHYTVNLYPNQIEQLNQKGGIIRILDNSVMVLKEGFYKEDFGVFTEGEMEFLEV